MLKKIRSKLNNRGVSIAEAVVAMAIIVIVSAAAMSCVEAFSRNSSNVEHKNNVIIAAENIVEIFKATDSYASYTAYRTAFLSAEPEPTPEPDPEAEPEPETPGVHTYSESYIISGNTVTADFVYNESLKTGTVTVVVTDSRGRTILSVDNYEKSIRDTLEEFPAEEP